MDGRGRGCDPLALAPSCTNANKGDTLMITQDTVYAGGIPAAVSDAASPKFVLCLFWKGQGPHMGNYAQRHRMEDMSTQFCPQQHLYALGTILD